MDFCPEFKGGNHFNFLSQKGVDEKGDYLFGGLFFAVWALVHDLDHGVKCYGQPKTDKNSPCNLCHADSKKQPWYHTRKKWAPVLT